MQVSARKHITDGQNRPGHAYTVCYLHHHQGYTIYDHIPAGYVHVESAEMCTVNSSTCTFTKPYQGGYRRRRSQPASVCFTVSSLRKALKHSLDAGVLQTKLLGPREAQGTGRLLAIEEGCPGLCCSTALHTRTALGRHPVSWAQPIRAVINIPAHEGQGNYVE